MSEHTFLLSLRNGDRIAFQGTDEDGRAQFAIYRRGDILPDESYVLACGDEFVAVVQKARR